MGDNVSGPTGIPGTAVLSALDSASTDNTKNDGADAKATRAQRTLVAEANDFTAAKRPAVPGVAAAYAAPLQTQASQAGGAVSVADRAGIPRDQVRGVYNLPYPSPQTLVLYRGQDGAYGAKVSQDGKSFIPATPDQLNELRRSNSILPERVGASQLSAPDEAKLAADLKRTLATLPKGQKVYGGYASSNGVVVMSDTKTKPTPYFAAKPGDPLQPVRSASVETSRGYPGFSFSGELADRTKVSFGERSATYAFHDGSEEWHSGEDIAPVIETTTGDQRRLAVAVPLPVGQTGGPESESVNGQLKRHADAVAGNFFRGLARGTQPDATDVLSIEGWGTVDRLKAAAQALAK